MHGQFFKSRFVNFIFFLFVIFTVSGCSHYRVDFNLKDSAFKAKGKSIAVISGTKEQYNVAIAKLVGESLRKNSRYQVASASQISQAIEPYPQTIKGPYKSAYFYIDTDWDLGDRRKIAEIHRSLGADYLYVIWAPIAVSQNGHNISTVHAVAQLFEQPGAKEVAQTSIQVFIGDEGNVLLKEGVEEISRQLAEETKMAIVTRK